jgi:hypothetical protein
VLSASRALSTGGNTDGVTVARAAASRAITGGGGYRVNRLCRHLHHRRAEGGRLHGLRLRPGDQRTGDGD